jgi:hypothetical protein
MTMHSRRSIAMALAAACITAGWQPQLAWSADPPKRKPDLADAAEGQYFGDVISDSKGASQSDVTLTVKRVGPNLVRITTDYARLPVVQIPLTQAMGKILQARGDSVFLLDRSQTPAQLDVTFLGEVSWSGKRR